MPELPDVEGFRRYWSRYLTGERIRRIEVPAPAIVRNRSARALGRALAGRRFERPDRHGKWMLAPADGPILLLHFGMTGLLHWSGTGAEGRHRHDRLVVVTPNGEMRYRNMRMLGGAWLARDEPELEGIVGSLGPDAADLDTDQFVSILDRRRGGVKATLMNQRVVAGIGNELSDEILWRARIHPARPVSELSLWKRRQLAGTAADVLAESSRHGRIPREPGWLEEQRGRRDARCPRCGRHFQRTRIAGRTSYWCPRCQRP
ncbi:MAG: Fpg/Nei family DNA glycosylase [Solirubrobacterales bacterium]